MDAVRFRSVDCGLRPNACEIPLSKPLNFPLGETQESSGNLSSVDLLHCFPGESIELELDFVYAQVNHENAGVGPWLTRLRPLVTLRS